MFVSILQFKLRNLMSFNKQVEIWPRDILGSHNAAIANDDLMKAAEA